jgi:hypothetical protein
MFHQKEINSILSILACNHFSFAVYSASGGQGALFIKTAPWTPAKIFY